MNSTSTNLIVLADLKGNEATHLSYAQPFLMAHLDVLATIWWIAFFSVLAYLFVRSIALPLLGYSRTTE